ncbi:hypothetical protein [Dyella silvatica]|uniref:hypothetical protein n=1 Tax=Dyella silvatica TaxID=2992128 RepID=UPI002257E422|nr:hypothetical protein [Dyella silvatica]
MTIWQRRLLLGLLLLISPFTIPVGAAQTPFQSPTHQDYKVLRAATPFQDNNGSVPSSGVYSGPLFKLNHAWPTQAPSALTNAPWQAAIKNGNITPNNALDYANALKAAVAKNARELIMHYETWDAAKAGWYNEPWLGSLREAIRGTYGASDFGPDQFPGTDLLTRFNTHVLTYYDARAAYTLRKFWGDSATKPTLLTNDTQFTEGSLIIKAAIFTSEDAKDPLDWWKAMKGAQVWNMYLGVGPPGNSNKPQVWPGYVAQFDIIVKDSQSSPDTGWVFVTLVYDSRIDGDIWDKMVPLGAQWGNDPQATADNMTLHENWINPSAPFYATRTLGWGGRLSGPNDGARNNIVINGVVKKNFPDSACMSCHSTAQWNVSAHKMDSFLLPSIPTKVSPGYGLCDNYGKPNHKGSNICSPEPGSTAWMKWFQDRRGTRPMDSGSIATDFDLVFSFKSLKLWWLAEGPPNQEVPQLLRQPDSGLRFNLYTGAPLASPEP